MGSKNKKDLSVVIVGNGMVGYRLCQQLRRAQQFAGKITVFGEEPRPAYDRVNLTRFFEEDDPDALLLAPANWYQENDIVLRTERKVISIDREQRLVKTEQGEEVSYDKLVFATGSYPFVPPMEGVEGERIFVYRTIEDLIQIRDCSRECKTAAVIGGGLLGLEAAKALHDLGLKTHIVEFAQGLMPRQLNKEGSTLLERKIESMGLELHLKKQTLKIESEDGVTLHFAEGEPLSVDMVVISAGIRPRDELAEAADLRTGIRGGIIVNDLLQSSDESIYALGECALHGGQIYGLVAPGYAMADALAKTLVGEPTEFKGADLSSRLKLLGVELSTFGDYLGEDQHLTYKTEELYRDIVLRGSELVGATSIGEWDQAGLLQIAIDEKRWLSPSDQKRFSETGDLDLLPGSDGPHSWPPHAIVCNCTGTTRGQLTEQICAGCTTLDSLAAKTGASTVCGSCRPLLAQMVGVGADAPEAIYRPRGRKGLMIAGMFALVLGIVFLAVKPIPAADSVQSPLFKISQLWTDGFLKKVTGFTLMGLSLLALLLPLRKRIKRFSWLHFGIWRMVHAVLGLLCLVVLLAHTGFSMGDNLNFWLMFCFLGLNIVGALAGGFVAMEEKLSGPRSRWVRKLLTQAHIVFFWPFPVLLAFHVLKVFLY